MKASRRVLAGGETDELVVNRHVRSVISREGSAGSEAFWGEVRT